MSDAHLYRQALEEFRTGTVDEALRDKAYVQSSGAEGRALEVAYAQLRVAELKRSQAVAIARHSFSSAMSTAVPIAASAGRRFGDAIFLLVKLFFIMGGGIATVIGYFATNGKIAYILNGEIFSLIALGLVFFGLGLMIPITHDGIKKEYDSKRGNRGAMIVLIICLAIVTLIWLGEAFLFTSVPHR